jgi:hypothetical protein
MPNLPTTELPTPSSEIAALAAVEIAARTGVNHHDIALTLGSG